VAEGEGDRLLAGASGCELAIHDGEEVDGIAEPYHEQEGGKHVQGDGKGPIDPAHEAHRRGHRRHDDDEGQHDSRDAPEEHEEEQELERQREGHEDLHVLLEKVRHAVVEGGPADHEDVEIRALVALDHSVKGLDELVAFLVGEVDGLRFGVALGESLEGV
jgi:hypothetical protein